MASVVASMDRYVTTRPLKPKKIEDGTKECEKERVPNNASKIVDLSMDQKIIEIVPNKLKEKAWKCLNFARGIENITWDVNQAVKIDAVIGNIMNLVSGAVRFRANFRASSRKPFSSAMRRRADIPHKFVDNNQFWKIGAVGVIPNTNTSEDRDVSGVTTIYTSTSSHSSGDTSLETLSENETSAFRPMIRSAVLNTTRQKTLVCIVQNDNRLQVLF